MCGLTGWVAFDRDLRGQRTLGEAMTATLACRGPDDASLWLDRHALLGHRRLAVIDPAGGRQPMTHETPDGPVCLVYSGEVYNFTELRAELALAGHRFATRCDTEVVLRGYLQWGAELAGRLNGMYAFAVWDGRSRRLLLVRDRIGVKPLYYHRTRDGIVFGSEIKAVLAHPESPHEIGVAGLRELFTHVKPPGVAIWEGIHEVPPGTVVDVDAAGLRTNTYWTLTDRDHPHDRDATVARVRELLEDIVARQLVADVPRGVLLSGGLDSSALTALAGRRLEPIERPRTFAVDFVDHEKDFVAGRPQMDLDGPYVRDVVERVGTRHTDVVLDADALTDPALREKALRSMDVPGTGGDRDISMYLLFRGIRQTSTVALSGEAADELFGGYVQFFSDAARWTDMFPWLAHYADQVAEQRLPYTPELARALDVDAYLRDSYADAVAGIERVAGESELEYRMRRINHLHLTRFAPMLLDRKDRLSMASGLEVRVPYCDYRLIEYVYNTPWSIKYHDGREKSLLRAATADLLPLSVRHRVKSGYPAIQAPRYLAVLREQAAELLDDPGHRVFGLYRHDWLAAAVATPPAGMSYPTRLTIERVLAFALWLDLYRPNVKLY